MTTTCAVAARHVAVAITVAGNIARKTIRHAGGSGLYSAVVVPRFGSLLGAVVVGAAVAGCGSTGLLDSTAASDVQAINATQPASAPATVSQSRVGLAPVMGAPEAVSKQVGSQLNSSLQRQRVGIAQGSDPANYTLRGYMVATREKAGTKVAYIFDLTDTAGKRVNRIQGEEMAQGGGGSDAWSAVTPEVSQRITDKTASSLAAMLAALPGGSGAATAMAPPVGAGAGAVTAAPQQVSAVPAAAGPTTGSINPGAAPGALVASIPAVTGAPGDGNAALANAMRQELQQAGVNSASPGQKGYTVAGKVTAGPVKDGKQSIKIDWRVTDPAGGLLATVSQNNDIQAGALDGSWGNIASDAAQGAASRIKQLIDDHRAGSGKVARARG